MTATLCVLAVVVALSAVQYSVTTPAHRPMGVTECHDCLLDVHANLTSTSVCRLAQNTAACLSACRPSTRPEVSLALLVDLYGSLRTAYCNDAEDCGESAALCLEPFVVRAETLLSSSLRCEDNTAKLGSLSCLSKAQMTNSRDCPWNPNGIVRYIVETGSRFLCDTSVRCYDHGNVFEALDGSWYEQYPLSSTNERQRLQCHTGTAFDTRSCSCQPQHYGMDASQE